MTTLWVNLVKSASIGWAVALTGWSPTSARAILREHAEPQLQLDLQSQRERERTAEQQRARPQDAPASAEGGPASAEGALAPEPGVLTPEEVTYQIGTELARRGTQLVLVGVTLDIERDRGREWFARIRSRTHGCELVTSMGAFETLEAVRVQAIAQALEPLITRCAGEAPDGAQRTAGSGWVKPAAAVLGAGSSLTLLAISQSSPPNLSLSFSHLPSAVAVSGLSIATAGSVATLLAPTHFGERALPLTFFSSASLFTFGLALTPEPGIPSYGGYALTTGYAMTSVLLGVDWVMQPSLIRDESPAPRTVVPWWSFAPAVVGSVVSLGPALSPAMESGDREIVVGFGAAALVPAGLALGLSLSGNEAPPVLVGGGPNASTGLSLAGSF